MNPYRMHNPGTSRHEQWYAENWHRWVSTGSLIAKWEAAHAPAYAAPVINPAPNPISPEREAEHVYVSSWVNEHLAAIYTEPDGAAGYAYTIEARYGVPVGRDWRKRPALVISLYHDAMTQKAA